MRFVGLAVMGHVVERFVLAFKIPRDPFQPVVLAFVVGGLLSPDRYV